jgi:hypothetical protein
MVLQDPEAARALLHRLLAEELGVSARVRERLDLPRETYVRILRRLGMVDVPRQYRQRVEKLFRLLPDKPG